MNPDRVLVVNAGSSTVKLSILDPHDAVVCASTIECPDVIPEGAVSGFLRGAGPIDAVGHRVVHGGAEFTGPTLLDAGVFARIAGPAPPTPLHQNLALAGIDAVRQALPSVPAVACFDTAFHRTLPPEASTYALPDAWRTKWGLRRYGFHGLSHAYAARHACGLAGVDPASARVVSCHLGAGASMAAVRAGESVDTTMGFTPAEGLVMATRAGDVDPGLIVWLLRQGITVEELEEVLEHGAGLVALAGHGGDMRAIRAAAEAGDHHARSARRVYAYRLRAKIAAMAAAMGGLDVLVFTGGVGEHDEAIRADAVRELTFLGVHLDPRTNAEAQGDADVSADGSLVRTLVVTAREDLEIARETRSLTS
ncbi:acetate/propionate family kinase [Embleya sp. NPDC008237]|uniref:acetate/propionate family kinase n=1 Tax=Embleya sp. NPDC008237 TaxID=3363978 RepID=UPI0036E626A3